MNEYISQGSTNDFMRGAVRQDEGMGNLVWYMLGMLRGRI